MSLFGTLLSGGTNLWAANEGMDEQRKYINEGTQAYKDQMAQGIAGLQAGQAGLAGGYSPYTTMGGDAAAGLAQGGYNAVMPGQPVASNYGPSSADPWLSKISDYSLRKANAATQASALAKGGMGGGLARALSDQSQDYAKQYWQDANTAAQNAANMNFGQQQQQYANAANWQNQQAGQQQAMAGLGLQAQSGLQGQNLDYARQLANMHETLGGGLAGQANAKANLMGQYWGTAGNVAGGMAGATGDAFSNSYMGGGGGVNNNASVKGGSGNLLSFLFG